MYACNCKEWLRSWPKLQTIFTVALHENIEYDGAAFRNCPWCGSKLRIGLPYTFEEQAKIEEEETLELPPIKPENFMY